MSLLEFMRANPAPSPPIPVSGGPFLALMREFAEALQQMWPGEIEADVRQSEHMPSYWTLYVRPVTGGGTHLFSATLIEWEDDDGEPLDPPEFSVEVSNREYTTPRRFEAYLRSLWLKPQTHEILNACLQKSRSR